MIILEKPYISDFVLKTVSDNNWEILDNNTIKEKEIYNCLNVKTSSEVKECYRLQKHPLIYSNSENAITWILDNLPNSALCDYIKFCKDKIEFRKAVKNLFPDFYFEEVTLEELRTFNVKNVEFPVIIKPAVGFLSFGVHTVRDIQEWNRTIAQLESEMQQASSLYPKHVVDSSKFIIEELIDGEEFAIDAYYNSDGQAVILNIFKHPFYDEKDVSDRIYVVSKNIMVRYMEKFGNLLENIGKLKDMRNFPFHLELRVTSDGKIIPIEINPMRFAGWCTTDVSKYAWGINIYECFYNQIKPNWNEILENADEEFYYFSMAEVPSDIEKGKIKDFDYERFLSNYSNILELRKINYRENPLFAVIFGSTKNQDEINNILSLKTKDYITF